MKTRRERKANLKKGRLIDSSTEVSDDSDPEVQINYELLTHNRNAQVQDTGGNYDADSEPSSSSETKSPKHPSWKNMVAVDEYDFTSCENEQENAPPQNSQSRNIPNRKLKAKRTIRQDAKQRAGTFASDEFKAPQIHSKPTPSLSSSLKTNTSPASRLLRVSFSDESISDINRSFQRTPLTRPRRPPSSASGGVETSTPTPAYTDNLLNKVPRVSLTRLPYIPSPILKNGDSVPLKRRRDCTPTESINTTQSSGYGSMAKSNSSATALDGSFEEPAVKKSGQRPKPQANQKPLCNPPKTAKQQKKLAVAKLKEREERYLAEMEELNDFDLCVE